MYCVNDDFCGELCIFAQGIIDKLKAEVEKLKVENEFHRKTISQNERRWLDFCTDHGVMCIGAFAEKIHQEILDARNSNFKAIAEREKKYGDRGEDPFISYCQGKIDALNGIDYFVDLTMKEMIGENE